MRLFSLVILLAAVGLGSVAPASAGVALRDPTGGTGDRLSLAGGRGLAVVTSEDGSILGKIRRGNITFTNYSRGAKTKFDARKWGCEKRKRINRKTLTCSGTDLHFSVVGGAWMLSLRGRGISASAVVRGKVLLRGTRGTFSINEGAKQKWPLTGQTYKLG